MNELEQLIRDESYRDITNKEFSSEILSAVSIVRERVTKNDRRQDIANDLGIKLTWLDCLMKTHGIAYERKNPMRQRMVERNAVKLLSDGYGVLEIKRLLKIPVPEILAIKKQLTL